MANLRLCLTRRSDAAAPSAGKGTNAAAGMFQDVPVATDGVQGADLSGANHNAAGSPLRNWRGVKQPEECPNTPVSEDPRQPEKCPNRLETIPPMNTYRILEAITGGKQAIFTRRMSE